MGEVVLDVPARPEYLSLVRQVVASAAAVQMVRDERIDALRLAVSEATTNAIESYAEVRSDGTDLGSQRIVVRCNLDVERVEVEVRDRAGGIDAHTTQTVAEPGSLDDPNQERGRGLPLMRHLADQWEITAGDGGTSVRLVVFTPWADRRGRPPLPNGRRRDPPMRSTWRRHLRRNGAVPVGR